MEKEEEEENLVEVEGREVLLIVGGGTQVCINSIGHVENVIFFLPWAMYYCTMTP